MERCVGRPNREMFQHFTWTSTDALLFMSFSPDGQILMLVGWIMSGEMVECAQGNVFMQSHNGWVWWVDCSPDGQAVASCSADQPRLWTFTRAS